MWQRIQTVYMILAVFVMAVVPFTTCLGIDEQGVKWDAAVLMDRGFPYMLIPILYVSGAVLVLINIFLYQYRPVQLKINLLTIAVLIILLGVTVYVLYLSGEIVFSKKGIEGFFPLPVIILLGLANRHIRKDETLVKSLDRIR